MDLNPIGGEHITDIMIRIYDESSISNGGCLPVKTVVRKILFDKKHPLTALSSMCRLTERYFGNHYL
jgi:hypothetical protein